MDLERIEAALRSGPPDEPAYVPGAYREGRGRSMAVAAAAVTGAMLLGVVLGLAVGLLRFPSNVGAPNLDELVAQIDGSWASEEISRDEWIEGLAALGHDLNDVEEFLSHDPVDVSVRYRLTFADTNLAVASATDGQPDELLSEGTFSLLVDGSLTWGDEGGTDISEACRMTAAVDVAGDRLTFGPLRTEGCSADERIAMSAFFNLAPYSRDEET